MTYQATIKVRGITISHMVKQPTVEAVKAKLARAYPDGAYAVLEIRKVRNDD